jgi:hypothetical protein
LITNLLNNIQLDPAQLSKAEMLLLKLNVMVCQCHSLIVETYQTANMESPMKMVSHSIKERDIEEQRMKLKGDFSVGVVRLMAQKVA